MEEGRPTADRMAEPYGAPFRRFTRADTAGRGALLDGLLTDAGGAAMLSTHSARPRFYIAVPLGDAQTALPRVPIVWLDKFVERLLRRMRVLPPDWRRDDVHAVLRRVAVSEAAVRLELDRTRSIANWRQQGGAFEGTSEREILRAIRQALPPYARVKGAGDTLIVRAQRSLRNSLT